MRCPVDAYKKRAVSHGETADKIRSEDRHAVTFPYAGITQVRFEGYDLRPGGHPTLQSVR